MANIQERRTSPANLSPIPSVSTVAVGLMGGSSNPGQLPLRWPLPGRKRAQKEGRGFRRNLRERV